MIGDSLLEVACISRYRRSDSCRVTWIIRLLTTEHAEQHDGRKARQSQVIVCRNPPISQALADDFYITHSTEMTRSKIPSIPCRTGNLDHHLLLRNPQDDEPPDLSSKVVRLSRGRHGLSSTPRRSPGRLESPSRGLGKKIPKTFKASSQGLRLSSGL
jgi:hypothetical protein